MKTLFDFDGSDEVCGDRPTLMPIQLDLLERGRAPYTQGSRRVIWQAPCGSGKTVVAAAQTERALSMGKRVLHMVHRRRLVDQMIWTLSRFGIAASPIMEGRERWNARVMCASRDTLLAMLDNGQSLPEADLFIPDEAHVAASKIHTWYLKNAPEMYWTGYTATPVKANGESLSPPYQALVCMAPTSELIRIGRLCPVKVYNPDAIGRRRRKGEKVKPVGCPVSHWFKYAANLPTVVFAANVNDSRAITQTYRDAGVTAEHIDASTPEEEREAVFERSRTGKTKVISNVGVMVEGVDLPWLRCCQILRGCNSLVLWIQASGRVMRAFPEKEFGIVLDHAGAAHEFGLPDSDFHWTLEDESGNVRKNKPPRERRPVTCMACGAVFVAKPACPECGKVLPKKHRKGLALAEQAGDGILTRYSGEQAVSLRGEHMMRLWNKFVYMGRAKGWQMRQVAGAFTREAKCPPWEADLDVPLPYGKAEWGMPVTEWIEMARNEVKV